MEFLTIFWKVKGTIVTFENSEVFLKCTNCFCPYTKGKSLLFFFCKVKSIIENFES